MLLELNVRTQEVRVVFEENHVVRTAGIHENGKIYLTIFKGMAYCVKLDGSIFCLDKMSGEVRWAYGKDEWISNIALLDYNRMLVEHIHGKFYIMDLQNGELICTKEAKGKLYNEAVFEKNRMYIGDADAVMDSQAGNMTCYEMTSQNDLTEIFSVNVRGGVSTKAVIDGDRLFFAAEDNYLYCVDKNTGEELMPKKKTKGICRNIVVHEKRLFLLSDKGQVECLEIL